MAPLILLLFSQCVFSAGQTAKPLSEQALVEIRFDQKMNQQVSLDLRFRDEDGKPVRLGDYFGRRPVVLVLGYYQCPMLCSLTLNGLIEAMQDLTIDVGKHFDILTVSINSAETPALAAAKKRTYLRSYGRHGAEAGWHFLTGDQAPIRTLADEVGFRYAYDARSQQFAHPSGVIILTPEGRIAHYLFGVTYSPKELDVALRDASARRVGSPIQEFLLLCFHYNPITSRYGHVVMTAVRVSGCAVLAALGLLIWFYRPVRRGQSEEARP